MQGTPNSNRAHIVLFGETNSGKSALFNALTDSDISIVSEQSGTTTDPVLKAMELIPFGPVVFVDTAGLNDSTELGRKRIAKSLQMLDRADYALYVVDPEQFDPAAYADLLAELKKRKLEHMVVLSKSDLPNKEARAALAGEFAHGANISPHMLLNVSVYDASSISALRARLAEELAKTARERAGLVQGLLEPGALALLVVPLDSAAPKGRLILPQVQVIRDCLDNGVRCLVVTPDQVARSCAGMGPEGRVDLVITDSQIFAEVAGLIPPGMPLTSFSILMARQKGDIAELAAGAAAIKGLKDGDRVLMAEVCTHNRTHEDIGKVKIPAALQKVSGKKLEFTHVCGRDFPENLADYALVVHCGACMITHAEMSARMRRAAAVQVPITNYGVVLAFCGGILERSLAPLKPRPEVAEGTEGMEVKTQRGPRREL